jgi:hypothetical protein
VIERGGLGVQLGALFNYAPKRNSLFQLGLLNYSFTAGLKYEKGFFFFRDHLQIGLVNKTYKNHGIQIGLINLSKDNEGIPIGLINTNTSHGRGIVGGNELSVGYNYAYNKEVSWSGGYGLELQFYKGEKPPVLSFYSDMLYLVRRNHALKNGAWMNKSGVALTFDIYKKMAPIRLAITWNTGFFSNELIGLDLPMARGGKKDVTIWPGLELGFAL